MADSAAPPDHAPPARPEAPATVARSERSSRQITTARPSGVITLASTGVPRMPSPVSASRPIEASTRGIVQVPPAARSTSTTSFDTLPNATTAAPASLKAAVTGEASDPPETSSGSPVPPRTRTPSSAAHASSVAPPGATATA